jgi:phage terminase large subunit-like protein
MDMLPFPVTPGVKRLAGIMLKARQATDRLRTFQPLPKQLPFIRAVLTDAAPWEHWYCAANRAGKSAAGAYCGATLARFGPDDPTPAIGASAVVYDRATSGWVIGPDFPTLRDVLMPTYFDNGYVSPTQQIGPFIPAAEIDHWSWDSQVLRLKGGSILGFKSNEQDTVKFAAAGKDWVHFDEEPKATAYEEVTLRVAGGRHLRIFGTATLLPPEGSVGGISWIYDDIIQPWQAGQRTDVAVYGASIYDNPYLLPDEIARLEARFPVGSLQRRIRLNGEWLPGMTGVPVYGNFDRQIHVRPQPPPSANRPLLWTLDFNVSPFCSLVAQQDRQRVRVLREFCLEPGSIPMAVETFRAAYPRHAHEVWLYGDASGGAREAQSGKSDWRVVLEYLTTYPSPVKLKVPEANPPVHARVNAVNLALMDEQGYSAVEIDPTCVELIADLERVIADGRGGILKSYRTKDPYSKRTHMSDALGYLIVADKPVGAAHRASRARVQVPRPQYGTAPASRSRPARPTRRY